MKVAQSCLSFCDRGLPGSSVHGILQARILEWAAVSFSWGSSQPRDRNQVSCIVGEFFTIWAMGKTRNTGVGILQEIFPTQESNWISFVAGGFFTSWATRDKTYRKRYIVRAGYLLSRSHYMVNLGIIHTRAFTGNLGNLKLILLWQDMEMNVANAWLISKKKKS